MADLTTFTPLFPDDDEAAILARMRAWANEGLDPAVDAERWVDTREGSHWYVATMPAVREIARLYDLAGTDVPQSGMVLTSWGEYLERHGEVQNIERLAATKATGVVTFTGPEGTVVGAGARVGVEPPDPDADAPEFEVVTGGTIPAGVGDADGELDLAIRAVDAGESGNVTADSITDLLTTIPLVSVNNAAETTGGTDEESDEALRARVLDAYLGAGAGTALDYERWGRAWAGVGRVTVIPLWDGPNTVKLIVTTADGEPVSEDVRAGLQADLDPTAGQGGGRAPIGAAVTVVTATGLAVTPSATVEFEPGFSLDGEAGTVALRDVITDALREYIERVESGGEVVLSQVAGRIVTVTGVHDVSDVQINGDDANLPIDSDPAQVPQMATPTLTAA